MSKLYRYVFVIRSSLLALHFLQGPNIVKANSQEPDKTADKQAGLDHCLHNYVLRSLFSAFSPYLLFLLFFFTHKEEFVMIIRQDYIAMNTKLR